MLMVREQLTFEWNEFIKMSLVALVSGARLGTTNLYNLYGEIPEKIQQIGWIQKGNFPRIGG